ncbi:MAG: TolC family protein [Myxococcota bacterium]
MSPVPSRPARAALTSLLLLVGLVLVGGAAAARTPAGATVRIAIVSDMEWRLGRTDGVLREELRALLEPEFTIVFPAEIQRNAAEIDLPIPSIHAELMARDDVDLVIALGPRATQALLDVPRLEKPAFGTFVLDRVLQGFPITPDGTSGYPNLTFLVEDAGLVELVERLGTIFGGSGPGRLAFLIDESYVTPDLKLPDELADVRAKTGVSVSVVAARRPYTDAVSRIPDDVDGVLVGPLFDFREEEVRDLANDLIRRRFPSMAVAGSREVELGILSSLSPSSDITRLARRVALQVQDVLLGKRPEDLPVSRESLEELTINVETARALDLPLRFDLLGEARLVGRVEAAGRRLTLEQAVRESLKANLDLKSQDRVVAAGREDVFIAISALLPQASVSANYARIDEGRAGFMAAENSTTVGASAQQLLFDQATLANIFVARSGLEALDEAREQVRQDIVLGTAQAFLEVLRAQTTFDVQRSNLEVTRANLTLARTRNELGAAAAGEVFRWEAEEADAARLLVEARAALQNQRITFNRFLNRPLEEAFDPVAVRLQDLPFTFSDPRVAPQLEAPLQFRRVADFLVAEAMRSAPELAVLDAQIDAQRTQLRSRQLSFVSPTLAAQADFDRLVADSGRGAGGRIGGDDNWSIGVEASIPIAEGGGRVFDFRKLREELSQLRIDRRSEAQNVEERVRRAANESAASFVSIQLSLDAARASTRNLGLVTESYARGALNVIDLIDAQDAAFAARQQAETAVFDHVLDLLELQRGIGRVELFQSTEVRRETLERLDRFLHDGSAGPGEEVR